MTSVERAKKVAPAKKRVSCLRERAENREVDCDSVEESVEEVVLLDVPSAIDTGYEEETRAIALLPYLWSELSCDIISYCKKNRLIRSIMLFCWSSVISIQVASLLVFLLAQKNAISITHDLPRKPRFDM